SLGRFSLIRLSPMRGCRAKRRWELWDATGFQLCRIAVSQEQQLFYSNDTDPGQDGAAIYYSQSENCSPCGIAINAYGLHGSYPHNTFNHGTRITKEVFDFLISIINK